MKTDKVFVVQQQTNCYCFLPKAPTETRRLTTLHSTTIFIKDIEGKLRGTCVR